MLELLIFISNYIFYQNSVIIWKLKNLMLNAMKVTIAVYNNKWKNYGLRGAYLETSSNPTVFSCSPAATIFIF